MLGRYNGAGPGACSLAFLRSPLMPADARGRETAGGGDLAQFNDKPTPS